MGRRYFDGAVANEGSDSALQGEEASLPSLAFLAKLKVDSAARAFEPDRGVSLPRSSFALCFFYLGLSDTCSVEPLFSKAMVLLSPSLPG